MKLIMLYLNLKSNIIKISTNIVPTIPPLLFNGEVVTNIQEKINIFNYFSAKQFTLVSSNSILPSEFTYMAEKGIHSIIFN